MNSVAPLPRPALRPALILDVDGTLCDVRSVRKYVEAPPGSVKFKPDFTKFHSSSISCPPYATVKKIAIRSKELGLSNLVVTGRAAKWKELTETWLDKNSIPYDQLYMRPDRDFRPDHEIKSEICTTIQEAFAPIIAIDDRDDILHVWEQAGISTARVSQSGAVCQHSSPKSTNISSYFSALEIDQAS